MNSCKPDFREGRLLIDAESRLDALARYDILDTDPEPSFDRITRIAATLLDVPIALINFLDERRQWSKSCVGIGADTHEVDLERSFCLHTLASDDVLVIDDTTQDARVADNPLVRDTPRLRSYLGAPLVTPDGYVIGTVCVLDVQPRAWTQAQCDRLVDLAAMAMSELELRCEVARREQTEAHLQTINANVSEGIYRSTPGGRIVYANQAMAQCFGYETPDALMRVQSGTLYAVPGRREQLQDRLQEQDTVDTGDILLRRADGTMFPGRIRVTAERDAEGRP